MKRALLVLLIFLGLKLVFRFAFIEEIKSHRLRTRNFEVLKMHLSATVIIGLHSFIGHLKISK